MVRENAWYRSVAPLPQENLHIPNERLFRPREALKARGSLRWATRHPAAKDMQLPLMQHTDGLTPREIGYFLGILESAAGVRRRTLFAVIRQAARPSLAKREEGDLS